MHAEPRLAACLISASALEIDASDQEAAEIRAWADPITSIVEVWLFGSRAKGTSRPDSDFDIGIVLAPPAGDHNWSLGAYLSLGRTWRLALEERLDRHVSLEAINSGAELEMVARSRCVLLWEREAHR